MKTLIILLFAAFSLNAQVKSKLVGKWTSTESINKMMTPAVCESKVSSDYQFNADGTYSYQHGKDAKLNGTYVYNADAKTLELSNKETKKTTSYAVWYVDEQELKINACQCKRAEDGNTSDFCSDHYKRAE